MSIGRAHKLQIQHAEELDVVDELAAAAKKSIILLPRQPLADPTSAIGFSAQVTTLLNRPSLLLTKGRLQTVNHLLHVLLSDRLEPPPGTRGNPPLHFPLPLPTASLTPP